MIPLPGASNKSRKITLEDRFSFGQASLFKEATRWNLLSTPEDLCCYHQTWASEKKKKKKKRKIKAHLLQHLSNSQTEQNINKKKQIRKLGEVGKLF